MGRSTLIMDSSDKEIQDLLKRFIMLSALAKDDSKSDPLPSFIATETKTETVNKPMSSAETRFPALRAKLAKVEQQNSDEATPSEE